MALINIHIMDFLPKKTELDLQLPIEKQSEYQKIYFEDKFKKIIDKHLGNIEPFHNLKTYNIYSKDNWLEYFDKNSHKFIKNVKICKTSYKELIKLLEKYDFQKNLNNQLNQIIRKRCYYCKRLFKCKNDISIKKLIVRAKTVLNTNDEKLINLFLKEKASVTISKIKDINNNIYGWNIQCREDSYFESPQDVLYYCYNTRSCSSECALKDVKNKSQEQLFDGNDILHTYGSLSYEIILNKKDININFFENIKGKRFGTTAF